MPGYSMNSCFNRSEKGFCMNRFPRDPIRKSCGLKSAIESTGYL